MSISFAERLRRRASEASARIIGAGAIAHNVRPMISFTFDDIPETAFSRGAEILEQEDVRGTFYVSGSLCGTQSREHRFITATDCIYLHERGHEIGCHTYSHRSVRDFTRATLPGDIECNRHFFAQLAGIRLDNFAYPFGGVSLTRKFTLRRTFNSCRSTYPGINVGRFDLGFLRAVVIGREIDNSTLQKWIDRAASRNGWLIFVLHDVAPEPTQWGCTPDTLREILHRSHRSGAELVTVREALNHARVRFSAGSTNGTAALCERTVDA